jgi:hypothetical protein
MTSVVMQPGTVGFDAAGFKGVTNFAPFPCDWLSFYLDKLYGVTRKTVEAAWRADKPVMLNYEGTSSAGLGGAATGRLYAQNALRVAPTLGFDFLSPIIFSFVDFGPTVAQFPVLDDCHKAMVDTMAGRPAGAYLPKNYGDHLVQQSWWPQDAPLWHWAGDRAMPSAWTWVQQRFGQKTYAGVTVDVNDLFKPMRFWNGDGPDTLDPVEDDVLTDADKAWFEETIQRIVFEQVLGLWREPEIHNYLVEHTTPDLNQIAQAVVAALPPSVVGTVDTGPLLAAITAAIAAKRHGTYEET